MSHQTDQINIPNLDQGHELDQSNRDSDQLKMIVFQNIGGSNQIFIHTEKQQYYSGEVVSGTVMLSVGSPMNVDSINVKLSGYEQAQFKYEVSRQVPAPTKENPNATRTEYETRQAREERTFFRRKYNLYAVKSTMMPGNYCFPFQFTLENHLPGTFTLNTEHGSSTDARVRYECRAEVQVPGIFESNLKHYQDILICQPLKNGMMAIDTYKETKVTFLCCIPKGTVSLAATIDKNAYAPGECVMLRLIVDNSKSQVDLSSFKFHLTQDITLFAGGQSKSMSRVVVTNRCDGVRKGDRIDRNMAVQLPLHCEPSTDGYLVKCKYTLVVELSVPWSPNVRVIQPVQVYAPIMANYSAQLVMPNNWQPTVMPVVNLSAMQYQSF